MKEKLDSSDLTFNYSKWVDTNGVEYILPPIFLNKELGMTKIADGNHTNVEFMISEYDNLLIFHEILSGQKYGFDISDISLDKIYFRGQNGKGSIWTRMRTESINDLTQRFHQI